jgi:hypothetical protein
VLGVAVRRCTIQSTEATFVSVGEHLRGYTRFIYAMINWVVQSGALGVVVAELMRKSQGMFW